MHKRPEETKIRVCRQNSKHAKWRSSIGIPPAVPLVCENMNSIA